MTYLGTHNKSCLLKRKKSIVAYIKREGLYKELALKFRVSISFVQMLVNSSQNLVRIEPVKHGNVQKQKINDKQTERIKKLVTDKNDATLEELRRLFELITQIKVSRATIGRMLQRLELTRKKQL